MMMQTYHNALYFQKNRDRWKGYVMNGKIVYEIHISGINDRSTDRNNFSQTL